MHVRSSLAVMACSAVLFACVSDTASPKGQEGLGRSSTTTTATADGGVGNGPSDTAATTSPAAVPGTVNVDAALTARDTYLDALAANDYPTALAVSRDALQSLAIVRSIVHAGNAERGGMTTSTYEQRSFEVASATEDEVRFGGRASLTSVVSGPSGPSVSTTDTLADLVVRNGPEGWRVAGATYNDAALISFPADAAVTLEQMRFKLTGSLAFAGSLAVIVEVVADGDHTLDVGDDALRTNDKESPSKAMLIVGGQPGYIYLTYPRSDEHPTEWHATVTIDGTEHPVSLTF